MKKTMQLVAIFLSLLMTCCATNTGAPFSQTHIDPKVNMGTVVFYRPYQFSFLGMRNPIGRWAIAANDKIVTALGDSTYSQVELPPGQYRFNARTSATDTVEEIHVKPGTIQYVKTFSRGFGGGWSTFIIMKEIDEQTAKQDLHDLALQINPEKWTYNLSHGD